MLLNKKAVKRYLHENNKRISDEALDVIEVKVKVLLDKVIRSVNNFKTIKAIDVSLFQVKIEV